VSRAQKGRTQYASRLIIWDPVSGIAMLARIAIGLVILDMAILVVAKRWSYAPRISRRDAESSESLNLDAL
jgi:hypothetical protein